jgi:site-specific DNA-methyltransferase (adenine-specific)
MNKELMFSSKDMTWETPKEVFQELDKEFNFTLDPCCSKETAKCDKYYTPQENGLIQDWSKDVVYVNPPYGREIVDWVRKSAEEASKGAVIVMLIPARTDTRWFHDYIYNKAEIRFLKGRIKFLQGGKQKDAAPFPTMLVIFKK